MILNLMFFIDVNSEDLEHDELERALPSNATLSDSAIEAGSARGKESTTIFAGD